MNEVSAAGNRTRSHKLVKTVSGPSRIRNKRQEKIVGMVDGYDSTTTISTAMRNVFLVWLIPAFALVAIGLGGLGIGEGSPTVREEYVRFVASVRVSTFLLSLFTMIMAVVWVVRSWMNVRRLGKKPHVGFFDIFSRHIAGLGVALFCLVVAFFVRSAALFMLALGGLALIYFSLMIPFMIFEIVRMLWRTSSPPNGYEEGLPHYGIVWFASWLVYSLASGISEVNEFSLQLIGLFTIVEGLACGIAAVLAARLVGDIARRQDERLGMIITKVEVDEEQSTTVTSEQIRDAWEASGSMVEFNH